MYLLISKKCLKEKSQSVYNPVAAKSPTFRGLLFQILGPYQETNLASLHGQSTIGKGVPSLDFPQTVA